MKRFAIILVAIIESASSFGQGYYPLAVGNRWDYGELMFPGGMEFLYSVRIVGDTVMPNGEVYAVETRPSVSGTRYLRQSGTQVFLYRSGEEHILYDFALTDGDTLVTQVYSLDSVVVTVQTGVGGLFGRTLNTWTYHVVPQTTTEGMRVTVMDSMGVSSLFSDPGNHEYLMGAVIDGVRFGTIAEDPGTDAYMYYPLAAGNEWFYRSVNQLPQDSANVSSVRVIGDSTFSNGRRYHVLSYEDVMGGKYVRLDSGSVYYLNPFTGIDQQVFNFNSPVGEPVVINWASFETSKLISIDTMQVLGSPRRVLTYELEGPLAYAVVRFCDTFGPMTEWRYSDPPPPWPDWGRNLAGCVIDGVAYGFTVDVTAWPMLPASIDLDQNFPNPFNAETQIRYNVFARTEISLRVLDLKGKEVRRLVHRTEDAGSKIVKWNGRDNANRPVSSGVYFYELKTPSHRLTKRMLLVK